jgi:hypothetical protein
MAVLSDGGSFPVLPAVFSAFRQARCHLRKTVFFKGIKWLQVLGTTETPHIDQGVRHKFHPVVALLDVLETEEQPLEFVLPCKRPLDALP